MKLTLHVKAQYFYAIKMGNKNEEYRLCTPYWQKRLDGKEYAEVEICQGYPSKHDKSRRITFPWQGYEVKEITHPHFGDTPVTVYAIKLGGSTDA